MSGYMEITLMKKIIVIADIHSNYAAFEASFNTIEKIKPDGIIFLGDYVTDFPYPQRTMELLYKCQSAYKCWFIKGNREDYLLQHHKNPNDGWTYSSSVGSLLYTYENLTAKDFDFFDNLPNCLEIKIDNMPVITACHGSPKSTMESILANSSAQTKYVKHIKGNILLCGHSHHKRIVSVKDKQIVFCPSLGLPQDGEEYGHTYITLLTSSENDWKAEFMEIKFDADALIEDYRKSNLPEYAPIFSECIIKNLQTNGDIAYQCVVLAWKKGNEDHFKGGKILPEKYWIQAAKELEIIE